MLCCSTNCKKFETCGHAYINNPNTHDNLEPFDKFGSGSYSYNSEIQQVECKSWTMCEDYNMWYPAAEKHSTIQLAYNYTEPHQITIDEILEGLNNEI